jgi:putative addiction module component (TIGR02574 family)
MIDDMDRPLLADTAAATLENLPPLTAVQRAEIERRLAEHAKDPASAGTWDEARARLWARIG